MTDPFSAQRQGQDLGLEKKEKEFLRGFSLLYTCNILSKINASSSSSGASGNPCTIYRFGIYSSDCEGNDGGDASCANIGTPRSTSSVGTTSCPCTGGQCGYTSSGSKEHARVGV
jgi:hypothetical protein